MADIEPNLRLHYVTAGKGNRTIVLLHGFPQTWWEWHHVIPALAENGFREAGLSRRSLTFGDHGAPLPGTDVFDRLKSDPRLWHFAFHNARDVAEMLVAGHEREYLQAFFYARSFDPSAIDLETYLTAYSAPGAMRASFELYRSFDQDAGDNREALRRNGKLTIPVLAVSGSISNSGPLLKEMMREVADNVTAFRVPATAHWIAEEQPQALTTALLEFAGAK